MRFLLGLIFMSSVSSAFAETCADHLALKERQAGEAVATCYRGNKTHAQCEDLRSKHQAVVNAVREICNLTGYNAEWEEPNCADMIRKAEDLVRGARDFCRRNPSSYECPGLVHRTETLLHELKTDTCRGGRRLPLR